MMQTSYIVYLSAKLQRQAVNARGVQKINERVLG